MVASYEVWDSESGNALGEYSTEAAALAIIRDTVHQHGRGAVATFSLLRINTRGRAKLIATGEVLADLALASPPEASFPAKTIAASVTSGSS